MITLHHLNNSRSHRILWLLEELGLEYEIKRYQRDPKTMLAPESLRTIHPLGKSPIITDGDVVVAESGAVIEYLLTTYGKGRLIPNSSEADHRLYTYFLHYAEGSVMPPLLLSLVFSKISKPPVPLIIRPAALAIELGVRKQFIEPQLRLHFDFMESELVRREWFAGSEFSAADIMMSYPIEVGAIRVGYERRPKLKRFLERVRSRDSYQKALTQSGETSVGAF